MFDPNATTDELIAFALSHPPDGPDEETDLHWEVIVALHKVGSSRVDLQACKLEYSIVSPK